jgi:hypothetical protein
VEIIGGYHPMDGSTTKLEHLKANSCGVWCGVSFFVLASWAFFFPYLNIMIRSPLAYSRKKTTKLEHLKAIEVKCEVIDENVYKVLQFLCTFNFCK